MSIKVDEEVTAGPVTLTPEAVAKAVELLSSAMSESGESALKLRIMVKPGGCSGFSYDMYFDSEVAEDDVVYDYVGLSVVVDSESVALLKGATLSYTDALTGAGFSFVNPNASRSCGCGNSFS